MHRSSCVRRAARQTSQGRGADDPAGHVRHS
jgi:hypothetical protein